ncbi:MAG: radical SAM protein [Promethearchaeota archaeon CR_4]|nr:MAG: radical SAM protein [Candidatus Lokiarchaeota archaeon CR_4]
MKGGKQEILPDGRARLAPYGLRKIEATLIENGFDENDIATVPPMSLSKFIGENTKVVGITAMNTNGLTYCDQTFTALVGFGSDSYNSYKFRSLMFDKALRSTRAKKILGGAGAWQVQGAYCRDYFGIDTIVMGEGENVVVPLFQQACEGKTLPPLVEGTPIRDETKIPCIHNGSIYGTVEISRGCGRNCQFCSPTKRLRRDIPLTTIEQEVKVNFRTRKNEGAPNRERTIFTPTGHKKKGQLDQQQERMIFLTTEDIMLYQCRSPDFLPNTEAILKLIKLLVDLGVETFQPSHISLAAVAASP